MGNEWDGDSEYVLVDTGSQFAYVRRQNLPTEHEYEASETPPKRKRDGPLCTCGRPKKSPIHK